MPLRSTSLIAALALILGTCPGIAKSGVDSVGQAWVISVTGRIPQAQLPKTSEMQLAGFDVEKYIEHACSGAWQADRCDLYGQDDIDGSLLGYLVVDQHKGELSFHTDTLTTPKSGSVQACSLGGKIEGSKLDPSKNFKARSQFETKTGVGMIYLEKVGDNLRVNDERWNYCYSDRHIDDVYVLLGSLVRALDAKRWPTKP